MSSEVDKVKKQLADVADLYEKERNKTTLLEQTLRDLRRREPIVQMLWQEVKLLRQILEKHLKSGAMQMNLPSGRLDSMNNQMASSPMTDKDRIAYLALRLLNSSQGMSISTEDLIRDYTSESIAGDDDSGAWVLSSGSAGSVGGNSNVSLAHKDASERLENIKTLEAGYDHLHGQGEIKFEDAAGLSSSAPTSSTDDRPKSPFAAAIAAAATKKAAGESIDRNVAVGAAPGASAGAGAGTVGADGHEYDANGIPKAPADLFDGIPFRPAGAGGKSAGATTASSAPVKSGPQPSKSMIKPRLKMKPLHWKQIIIGSKNSRTDIAARSIWQDVDPIYERVLSQALNSGDFESKFQSAPTKNDDTKGGASSTHVEEEDDKPKRLLDAKRHNQISFMLSKMPAFDVLKNAILKLDTSIITNDKLESLHKSLPTAEEISMVTTCGLPPSRLMLPEQWILVMATIPQLSARIECWRFSQIFDEQHQELHRPLARIETAVSNIRQSKALRQYFGIILAIGNYMNGGTPRGQADGFTLDSLSKIARIRNAENDASLLDFINEIAAEMYGESFFETLADEMSLLHEVRSASLKSIAGEGRKLSAKANLTMKMQSLVAAQASSNDPFEATMNEFNKTVDKKVKSLETLCKSIFSSFVGLMQYLEPTMDQAKAEMVNTEEFFSTIDDFAQGVVRARREANRKREMMEARIKQAQQMQQLKKAVGLAPGTAKPRRTVFNSSGAPLVQLKPTSASASNKADMDSSNKNKTDGGMFGNGFPKLRSVNRDDDNKTSKSTADSNGNDSNQGGNPFVKLKPVDRSGMNDKSVTKTNEPEKGTFAFAKLKPVDRSTDATKKTAPASTTEPSTERMVQLKPVSKDLPPKKVQMQEPEQQSHQQSVEKKDTTLDFQIPTNDSESSVSPPNFSDDSDDDDGDFPPPPPDFDDYDSDSD